MFQRVLTLAVVLILPFMGSAWGQTAITGDPLPTTSDRTEERASRSNGKLGRRELYDSARFSTVFIVALDRAGKAQGICSGSFLTNSLVLTNSHCVENAASGQVIAQNSKEKLHAY